MSAEEPASLPSSSSVNFAGASASLLSLAEGQTKRPFSNRFISMQPPLSVMNAQMPLAGHRRAMEGVGQFLNKQRVLLGPEHDLRAGFSPDGNVRNAVSAQARNYPIQRQQGW